jgi:hypothetical protein
VVARVDILMARACPINDRACPVNEFGSRPEEVEVSASVLYGDEDALLG